MQSFNQQDQLSAGENQRSADYRTARQYKHSINPDGGLDSLCMSCRKVIASGLNEWLLLERERRHLCPGREKQ
jgi:hypothetical protein